MLMTTIRIIGQVRVIVDGGNENIAVPPVLGSEAAAEPAACVTSTRGGGAGGSRRRNDYVNIRTDRCVFVYTANDAFRGESPIPKKNTGSETLPEKKKNHEKNTKNALANFRRKNKIYKNIYIYATTRRKKNRIIKNIR